MKLHQLELFYYVAKSQGISAAIRNIPYGIQQPAISRQTTELEKDLNVPLFVRQPFALTPAGKKLYHFLTPLFDNMESLADELRSMAAPSLRVATSSIVLRGYIHEILQGMRDKYPNICLTLKEANHPDAETVVERGEMDIAISIYRDRRPPGIQGCELIRVPMVLLVNQECACRSAKEILKKAGELTLISLPEDTTLASQFQAELKKRNISWHARIEVGCVDVVRCYVAKGFGVGVSVLTPQCPLPTEVQVIPLASFAPVRFGAFWRGKLPTMSEYFLELVKAQAELLKTKVDIRTK
jgi:DNA-binding transcriptional LysR family regulator